MCCSCSCTSVCCAGVSRAPGDVRGSGGDAALVAPHSARLDPSGFEGLGRPGRLERRLLPDPQGPAGAPRLTSRQPSLFSASILPLRHAVLVHRVLFLLNSNSCCYDWRPAARCLSTRCHLQSLLLLLLVQFFAV